jgi:hypothetical protein
LRSVIDRSSKYRQLLDQQPANNFNPNQPNYNQGYNNNNNNPQRAMRQQQPLPSVDNDSPQPRHRARQVTPMYDPLMQQQQLQPLQSQLTSVNQQGYNSQQQQQQQLLNRVGPAPFGQYNNNFAGNFQYVTVLAPRDASLLAVRDSLLSNDSAIDAFLSDHIIVDTQGGVRVFYTDHDENVFQNGQTYATLNPNLQLVANVVQNPSMPSTG